MLAQPAAVVLSSAGNLVVIALADAFLQQDFDRLEGGPGFVAAAYFVWLLEVIMVRFYRSERSTWITMFVEVPFMALVGPLSLFSFLWYTEMPSIRVRGGILFVDTWFIGFGNGTYVVGGRWCR